MVFEKISLDSIDKDAFMESYVLNDPTWMSQGKRPAMVIVPGGGYDMVSENESEPVVRQFIALGFNCFVVSYSIGEKAVFPRPLVQLSKAVSYVRENSEKYNIDVDRVFLCGFSAGGHLAGCLGTFWNSDFSHDKDIKKGTNRPDGTILCYPVISGGEMAHKTSFYRILGTDTPNNEQLDLYSLEKHVTDDTAPVFMWQTFEDECVPVENAMLYANALKKKNKPFELHIYPFGYHGMSVCYGDSHVANWMREASEWTKIIVREK